MSAGRRDSQCPHPVEHACHAHPCAENNSSTAWHSSTGWRTRAAVQGDVRLCRRSGHQVPQAGRCPGRPPHAHHPRLPLPHAQQLDLLGGTEGSEEGWRGVGAIGPGFGWPQTCGGRCAGLDKGAREGLHQGRSPTHSHTQPCHTPPTTAAPAPKHHPQTEPPRHHRTLAWRKKSVRWKRSDHIRRLYASRP